VMGAEASSVMLINDETGFLECEVALGEVGQQVKEKITLKMGEGIAGWVAQSGKAVIVPDARKDPRFNQKVDEETGFETRSILAVPLVVKDRIIGVAEVINPLDGRLFTDDDLHLFSTFGRQVALAIENARMHKMMLEQQKFEQQLEAARTIQESFMPQSFPVSKTHRFDVYAKTKPATFIGGDFYDFFEFNSQSLGLIIGDVSGKGIPAALYMARLVSDFRFYTQREHDPAKVLAVMNDLLVERGRRGMFVTLQFLKLDIATGEVEIANAGHLPALHLCDQGKQCVPVANDSGIPLGILPGATFETRSIRMRPGDYLVCFTDGLIEARNRRGTYFTMDRLRKGLRQPWDSAQDVVDDLIRQVQAFSKGASQHDDLTVSVLRWAG